MKLAPAMKSVRFATVVERCGAPVLHVSWLPPAKDRELQAAEKQQRVMTLHQHARGAKKDFATIGLDLKQADTPQILIFPKSLRAFAGQKIIAINYALLAEEKSAGGDTVDLSKTRAKPIEPERPAPSLRVVEDEPERAPSRDKERTRSSHGADRVAPKSAPRQAKERAGSRPSADRVAPKSASTRDSERTDSKLVAEVRAAVEELKAGKQVAAYERLQALLARVDA